MAKEFLFASWEGGGNIPPMLTLARRLLDRGHRVRVLGDDASAEEIRQAGAEFRPWRTAPNRPDRMPESDPHKDWEIEDPRELLPLLLETQVTGPALAHATDVIEELKARPADAVIAGDLQLGPLVGAEAASVPQAILSCNIPCLPRAGIPPFGPGLTPAENEQDRRLQEQIGAGFGALFDAGLAPLNEARMKLGLKPVETVIEQLHRPALHLVASAEAFDFPTSEQPANLRSVGPLLDPPG
ncbi:MAG TPA: hypothetical protein VGW38_10835 [Chloroflexota bacterium]|nr:hypothetical protein [Chloroflexota bacterium]